MRLPFFFLLAAATAIFLRIKWNVHSANVNIYEIEHRNSPPKTICYQCKHKALPSSLLSFAIIFVLLVLFGWLLVAGTVVTTFIRFAKQRSFVSLISSLSSRFSLRFSLLCLCFTLFFLLDIQLSLSHSHILSVLFLFSPSYCYSFSPASVEFSHCFTSRTTKKKTKAI